MPGEVAVRPFDEADLPAVLDVMRAALGEPPGLGRTPELFAWKHLENPFGRSLMLVAESEGVIAGFRAFMRWELLSPTGTLLSCVRAVDTATHPDFQRRGIFRTLTMAGIEMATDDGVDLIFNTPNEKSGAGYLTMGWQRVGPIGIMARPGRGLLGLGGGTWPEPRAWSPADTIEEGGLDVLAQGHGRGLATPRSRDYYRWRFAAHPTGTYVVAAEPDGAAVGRLNMRNGRRELVISELGGARAPRMVRTLIRRFRPDYTVAWFSADTAERRWAMAGGLLPVPRVSALTLVARPLRPLEVEVGVPAAWDLGLGDLELL